MIRIVNKKIISIFAATSIDCYSLSPPANGEVFFTTTFSGSTAEYSCNEGFNISGIHTRTCLVNGEWSDETPTCVGED